MQATVLDLFNALVNIARGGKIPVALAMFWRMLDFRWRLRRQAIPVKLTGLDWTGLKWDLGAEDGFPKGESLPGTPKRQNRQKAPYRELAQLASAV